MKARPDHRVRDGAYREHSTVLPMALCAPRQVPPPQARHAAQPSCVSRVATSPKPAAAVGLQRHELCTCLCPNPRVLGRQVELGLPVSSIGASWLSHGEETSNDEGGRRQTPKRPTRALWELKVADMTKMVVRVDSLGDALLQDATRSNRLAIALRFGRVKPTSGLELARFHSRECYRRLSSTDLCCSWQMFSC